MMLRYSFDLDKEADAIEAGRKAGIERQATVPVTLCHRKKQRKQP